MITEYTNEYYVPEKLLKRAAKRLCKQIDITHVGALDELAMEQGFRDWSELKQKGFYCESEDDPFEWIDWATDKIISLVEGELSEED